MYPPYNTKLYRVTQNNQVQTLIFKRSTGTKLLLEDETGLPVTMPTNQYQNLFMSKRMVLTELEEYLRRKLDLIQEQLRELDASFNPALPEHSGYKGGKPRKVYQYDAEYGVLIRSFPSARNAASTYGGDNSNVAKCCQGIQQIAYGFRWSYEKFDRLPSFI